jgi:IS30 family transposase
MKPFLKRRHKRRLRKYLPWNQKTPRIIDRILIEERPQIVNSRRFYGHWEADTVESVKTSQACLNTLNERKSKLVKITKLPKKTADNTYAAIASKLREYPERLRQTLTVDNGSENAKHQEITQTIKTKVYFAHPYCACERGTNENTNGLIRYYFPKGTDFATVTEEEIQRVEDLLNNRPRKSLNYRTPLEAINKAVALSY